MIFRCCCQRLLFSLPLPLLFSPLSFRWFHAFAFRHFSPLPLRAAIDYAFAFSLIFWCFHAAIAPFLRFSLLMLHFMLSLITFFHFAIDAFRCCRFFAIAFRFSCRWWFRCLFHVAFAADYCHDTSPLLMLLCFSLLRHVFIIASAIDAASLMLLSFIDGLYYYCDFRWCFHCCRRIAMLIFDFYAFAASSPRISLMPYMPLFRHAMPHIFRCHSALCYFRFAILIIAFFLLLPPLRCRHFAAAIDAFAADYFLFAADWRHLLHGFAFRRWYTPRCYYDYAFRHISMHLMNTKATPAMPIAAFFLFAFRAAYDAISPFSLRHWCFSIRQLPLRWYFAMLPMLLSLYYAMPVDAADDYFRHFRFDIAFAFAFLWFFMLLLFSFRFSMLSPLPCHAAAGCHTPRFLSRVTSRTCWCWRFAFAIILLSLMLFMLIRFSPLRFSIHYYDIRSSPAYFSLISCCWLLPPFFSPFLLRHFFSLSFFRQLLRYADYASYAAYFADIDFRFSLRYYVFLSYYAFLFCFAVIFAFIDFAYFRHYFFSHVISRWYFRHATLWYFRHMILLMLPMLSLFAAIDFHDDFADVLSAAMLMILLFITLFIVFHAFFHHFSPFSLFSFAWCLYFDAFRILFSRILIFSLFIDSWYFRFHFRFFIFAAAADKCLPLCFFFRCCHIGHLLLRWYVSLMMPPLMLFHAAAGY